MSPSDVRTMRNAEVLGLVVDVKPSDEVLAWLSSVIADPVKVAGVEELSRRYEASRTPGRIHGHMRSTNSIRIDPAKYKHAMWKRRIALRQVGPMIGRSEGLGSVLASKARINYFTLDDLATAIGMHVDTLIAEICADEELERLSL